MEIPSNVDDLLIESMSGQKLDPLPEKPLEVPRETVEQQQDSAGLPKVEYPEAKAEAPKPKVEPEKPKVEPEKPKVEPEKPKVETNEYGDKAESAEKEEPENEYGLEVETPKTYTKAEMDAYANQIVRERLARLERNSGQQATPQQVQQHQQATQQGFQYDENSNLDWQQQLEQFMYQAIDRREQQKAVQLQQAIEQERLASFEAKFKNGMDKFKDYHNVVSGKNVTNEMLLAASEIADPAALFYAAAKRMPEELERIAKIPNPYAQAAAIGKLDEKLRVQPKKTSAAPKPVSQTKADTTVPVFKPKQVSDNELDNMLLADNAKRLTLLNSRRR
jgi:hypothetical protein